MQVLQFLAGFAGFGALVLALLAVPARRTHEPTRPGAPPPYRARHDPRRPALGLRPKPESERGRLALWRDQHPGWSLTGAEGLERDEVEDDPKRSHEG